MGDKTSGCSCCGCIIATLTYPSDDADSSSEKIEGGDYDGWDLLRKSLPKTNWSINFEFSHNQEELPTGPSDIANLDFELFTIEETESGPQETIQFKGELTREVYRQQFDQDTDDGRDYIKIKLTVGGGYETVAYASAPCMLTLQYDGDRVLLTLSTGTVPGETTFVDGYPRSIITESTENPNWPEGVIKARVGVTGQLQSDGSAWKARIASQSAKQCFWQLATPESKFKFRSKCDLPEVNDYIESQVKITISKTRDRENPLGSSASCYLYTECLLNDPSYSTPRWKLKEVVTPTGILSDPSLKNHFSHAYEEYNTYGYASRYVRDSPLIWGDGKNIAKLQRMLDCTDVYPPYERRHTQCQTFYTCRASGDFWTQFEDISAIHSLCFQSGYLIGGGSWEKGTKWIDPSFRIAVLEKDEEETLLECVAMLGYFPMFQAEFDQSYGFDPGTQWAIFPSFISGTAGVDRNGECIELDGRKYILNDDAGSLIIANSSCSAGVACDRSTYNYPWPSMPGIFENRMRFPAYIVLRYLKTVPTWRSVPPTVKFDHYDLVGYTTSFIGHIAMTPIVLGQLLSPGDDSHLRRWLDTSGGFEVRTERHHAVTSIDVTVAGNDEDGVTNWYQQITSVPIELDQFSVEWAPATHPTLLHPNYP